MRTLRGLIDANPIIIEDCTTDNLSAVSLIKNLQTSFRQDRAILLNYIDSSLSQILGNQKVVICYLSLINNQGVIQDIVYPDTGFFNTFTFYRNCIILDAEYAKSIRVSIGSIVTIVGGESIE